MSIKFNTTITKLWITVALVAFAAAPVFAHGGFDHVMGTVVNVANNVLTVNTGKANVAVKLDAKTELTKDGRKCLIDDLTPGARVVVDVPEGSKDKLAHSVKIGAAAKADDHHSGAKVDDHHTGDHHK